MKRNKDLIEKLTRIQDEWAGLNDELFDESMKELSEEEK